MKQQKWDKAANKKYMGKVFWVIYTFVPICFCGLSYKVPPLMNWIKSFFPENYTVESWLWLPIAIWTAGAFTYGWMHELIPEGNDDYIGPSG